MTRDEAIAQALEQLNRPPQQRYSGRDAIARRDELLRSRHVERPTIQTGHKTTTILTEKDLGT